MGNDGGSIPTRRELVKNAARALNTTELKATQQEAQTHAWTWCPLSNRPLNVPIVSDCAGILYNKDAIIEQLLPKDPDTPATVIKEKEDVLQGRVKGLRDVVEIKFNVAKENKEDKWICPVTSKELGPNTKSVYLVPCGHAFSEAAIKEVKGDVCVECNGAYKENDIIPIIPLAKEDIAKLEERMVKLKEAGLTHSLKKAPGSKKRKKGEAAADTKEVSHKLVQSSGIKNSATASLTQKVLDEQEERNKRRKMGLNENLKSLFSNTGYSAQTHKSGDFMTRGFSIPKKN
ncbi:hypothetical protein LZ554_005105 [Drepanopeziza brunnea f. sp. 'monogermtubi']|nr:hypothetical protein LZ554_005105 [Drepanopeziza brunnea f. sp. 'monogermtubi']